MGVAGRLVKWTIGLGLAILAISIAGVIHFSERNLERYGNGRALEKVDAVIVLGGGVDGDGILGFSSRRRVQAGVDLLAQGKARSLILSGGSEDHPGRPTLARLMRDHALERGAPPEALLVEERSVSTFENLRFSFETAAAERFERLAVATDAFHVERAAWLAAYYGRPDIGLVAVSGLDRESDVDRAAALIREALAWWLNLGKVIGWEGLALAGIDPEERRNWIR